jgi:hypothetical protein
MAVVTPMLLALVGGVIEYGYVFMAQSVLTNATREACRFATLPGERTEDDIKDRFEAAADVLDLEDEGQANYVFEFVDATDANPVCTVRVWMPWDKVSLTGGFSKSLLNVYNEWESHQPTEVDPPPEHMYAECSMRKEGAL